MDIQHLLLAVLSVILMPAVLATLGSSVAGVLAQRGFPAIVNQIIAWLMILGAAAGNVYIAGLWTGDPTHILQLVAAAATLLAGGTLHSLSPWLSWFDFLRDHVFSVVTTPAKPVSVISVPPPEPIAPPPPTPITPISLRNMPGAGPTT